MRFTEETIIIKLKNYPKDWKKEAVLFYEMLYSYPLPSHNILPTIGIIQDHSQLFSSTVLGNIDLSIDTIAQTADHTLYLEWIGVNRELRRLLFYVSLLPTEAKMVIEKYYFNSGSISELEETLFCSRRTVIRRKERAITDLAEIFNYHLNYNPTK